MIQLRSPVIGSKDHVGAYLPLLVVVEGECYDHDDMICMRRFCTLSTRSIAFSPIN